MVLTSAHRGFKDFVNKNKIKIRVEVQVQVQV